jgi:hypothetical protein
MSLIAPVLNTGLKRLTKLHYGLTVIGALTLICASSISNAVFFDRIGLSTRHMICLYIIAGYFRVHGWGGGRSFTFLLFIGSFWLQFKNLFHLGFISNKMTAIFPRFARLWSCLRTNMEPKKLPPYADYQTLPNVLLTFVNLLLVRYISITGAFADGLCFLGRYSFGIFPIHCHPVIREDIFHYFFMKPGYDYPESACFWNHINSTISTSLICIVVDIYRELVFSVGMLVFDLCGEMCSSAFTFVKKCCQSESVGETEVNWNNARCTLVSSREAKAH